MGKNTEDRNKLLLSQSISDCYLRRSGTQLETREGPIYGCMLSVKNLSDPSVLWSQPRSNSDWFTLTTNMYLKHLSVIRNTRGR